MRGSSCSSQHGSGSDTSSNTGMQELDSPRMLAEQPDETINSMFRDKAQRMRTLRKRKRQQSESSSESAGSEDRKDSASGYASSEESSDSSAVSTIDMTAHVHSQALSQQI